MAGVDKFPGQFRVLLELGHNHICHQFNLGGFPEPEVNLDLVTKTLGFGGCLAGKDATNISGLCLCRQCPGLDKLRLARLERMLVCRERHIGQRNRRDIEITQKTVLVPERGNDIRHRRPC